tara:strand:- start:20511 stop:21239 length:729 start_codon:yes stop_codon:yes gene_type:complete
MSGVVKTQWIPQGTAKLLLQGNKDAFSITETGTEITSVSSSLTTIKLGETVKYKGKIPYKINKIKKVDSGYELIVADRTKSSLFMLPMFTGTQDLFLYNTLFVNAFVGVDGNDNCIGLLYRFSGDSDFLKFEQALRSFKDFKEVIDPSPYFVLFVFNVPGKFKDDYRQFIRGKYSNLSHELKENILKFHGVDPDSSLGQILYKSDKRKLRLEKSLKVSLPRNAELLDIPNIDTETFDKDIYL